MAFLVFLPNLLWNLHYDWPFIQLMRGIRVEGRDVVLPPLQYFFQQAFLIHPFAAPIWITGLIAFFFSPRLKSIARSAGVTSFATRYFRSSRQDLLPSSDLPDAPSRWRSHDRDSIDRPGRTWMKPAIIALLLVGGACLAPAWSRFFRRSISSLT